MVARQTDFASSEILEDYKHFLESEAIPILESDLAESVVDAQKKVMVNFSVFQDQVELTILKYTLGKDIDEVRAACEKSVKYLKEYAELTGTEADAMIDIYALVVWTLSIGYLCEVPFPDLGDKLPFVKEDMLVGRLYHAFDSSFMPSRKILFPKLYGSLCQAMGVYDEEERNQLLLSFLQGYFGGLEEYEAAWSGSHMEQDPEYFTHFGYWAFELAALVDMIGWNDFGLRDSPLYPKDLVDWKRAHKE